MANNRINRAGDFLGTLVLACLCAIRPSPARADSSSATVVVDVTINASLAVAIDGASSSSYPVTLTPGGAVVLAPSSATVTNTATGGLLEKWKLSSTNTVDATTLATGWTLVTSTSGAGAPGTDQFAIQALFVSSKAADCTSASIPSSSWDKSYAVPLGTTPAQYSSIQFADTTAISGASGAPDFTTPALADGRMLPGGKRGFCWRITPPAVVSSTDLEIISITITAVSP